MMYVFDLMAYEAIFYHVRQRTTWFSAFSYPADEGNYAYWQSRGAHNMKHI